MKLGVLAVVVGSIVIGTSLAIGAYNGIVDSAPDVNLSDLVPAGYSSALYDLAGNEITTLVASDANRIYTTIDNIPVDVQHAFVAIEDRSFYTHHGVDPRGMVRAFVTGIKSGSFSQGASTITQQLVKNNVFSNFSNESKMEKWRRKLQEQQIALNLEKSGTMSKDKILELYLNTINMGQNTLGIQSASLRYFNKDANDLTLSEGAVLAAIPQNPTKYNPITHPENNKERRVKVLNDMEECGFITSHQRLEALQDNVYARIKSVNEVKLQENKNSYFTDAVVTQVIEDLQNKLHYSEQQAYYTLYAGGLTIYTTLDPDIQRICDDYTNDESNFPSGTKYSFEITGDITTSELCNDLDVSNKSYTSTEEIDKVVNEYRITHSDKEFKVVYIPQPQLSMSIIDQSTGQVRAIIGGRGQKETARSFNRATDSMRQPGSTFKILSTFLPAFDTNQKTLNSTQVDEPYNYSTGTPVHNYYSGYKGTQTLRSAIEQSLNIVTVKTLTDITPELGFEYLKKLGFTTLVEREEKNGKIYTDVAQPLALGGITYGVKNVELCAAYAAIANDGKYNRPMFYSRVIDHEGQVLLSNDDPVQVCKSSTAYMLTSAMQDVMISGTGKLAKFEGQDMAGKTGTTSNNKDIWFVGYTPYYTCAVWTGYDDNSILSTAEERNIPKQAWKAIMSKLHEELPYKQFKHPDSIRIMKVCSSSHKIATDKCPSTYNEVFDVDNVPTDHCTSSHTVTRPSTHTTPSTPTTPTLTPEQQALLNTLIAAQAAQQQQQQ